MQCESTVGFGGHTLTHAAALFATERESLFDRYRDRIEINADLNRSLVSYQSNRKRPFYRWFKYKEGFSAALVDYVVRHTGLEGGRLLDPFAGTAAALMLGRERGFEGDGIEIMPIGVKAIQARLAADVVDLKQFVRQCDAVIAGQWRTASETSCAYRHLRITDGAFPTETERQLNQFRAYLAESRMDTNVRALLELACLSVLEGISYTRKDGQYLRWDHRAPRDLTGKVFDKGTILSFDEAMKRQLAIMQQDLMTPDLFAKDRFEASGRVDVVEGSCLKVLPNVASDYVDLVITSPPYCNRYDYTRTYALELAYLGIDEEGIKQLRQELLSCTVENRSKVDQLRQEYLRRGDSSIFEDALDAFEKQDALQEVLSQLDQLGRNRSLNNSNVPRMVRNYFLESAVVIFELARIVKEGGFVVMVNDNVQYGGEEVPVDVILSDIAAAAGFDTERIWVLPRGKGNSSQQMGKHGRNELRKCVYVWRR